MILFKKVFIRDIISDAIVAELRPDILTPGHRENPIIKTIPFNAKLNNPRLIIFNGRVKSFSIGFKNVFKTPKSIVNITKLSNVVNCIPSTISEVIYIDVAGITIDDKSFFNI